MTVYVDDAFIEATVPNGRARHTSRWSHLIADTEAELHDFAERLGMKREWFQQPKGFTGRPVVPDSRSAQNWHYDLTAPKRAQAIRMGAVPVTSRQMSEIITARHARLFPEAAAELERRRAETMAKYAHLRGETE
jgi:Protein of unknown function (DUF4031)